MSKPVVQLIEEDLQAIRLDEYREAVELALAKKRAKARKAEASVIVDEIFDVMRHQGINPNSKAGFRQFTKLLAKRMERAAANGGYARTLSGEEDGIDFTKKRSW